MNLLPFGRGPINLERLTRLALPRPPPGRFFTDAERRIIASVAEVVLADGPARIPPGDVADNLDRMLQRGRSRRSWRIRLLYNLVEVAPVLLLGQRPFSKQSVAERRRLMEEQFVHGKHLWRLCGKSRHLVYLCCYADPRANAAVGFVPVLERARYTRRRTG